MSGIIIALFIAYILVCARGCWFTNRKSDQHVEPEKTEVDTTYEELDLTKMNTEDNYQSLRADAANNVAENDADCTCTELNKTRDVEDNYTNL